MPSPNGDTFVRVRLTDIDIRAAAMKKQKTV